MSWIVLADIGTDWPDVFGPYSNNGDAHLYADELNADERVHKTEVQALFSGDEIANYLDTLDQALES